MKFSVIGTGNTAWYFATALHQAGHTCTGIYGRNATAAGILAQAVNGGVYDTVTDIEESDCCIIAISDSAVAEVAEKLAFKTTTLLHTAGSLPMELLAQSAVHYGVLWPIYSIVKTNLPGHRNVPMVWESSDEYAADHIITLSKSISDNTTNLTGTQRLNLHMAAVLGNNFTNHLFAICEQICKAQGISFDTLYPIIQQTAERIKEHSPKDLQTGPAKRGDISVMKKHVDLLSAKPEWQEVYKALSQSIAAMYTKD